MGSVFFQTILPTILIFFFEKLNIENFYCTKGDHRSNGLVERLVHTVKIRFLAIFYELPKLTLEFSIEKII